MHEGLTMFRAVPMVHLQVQVPSRDSPAVTRQIAAEGLLHLIDIAHGSTTTTGAASATRDLLAKFRDLEQNVRQLAQVIELPLPNLVGTLPGLEATEFDVEYQRIEQKLRPVREEIDATWRRLVQAQEDRTRRHTEFEHARRLRTVAAEPERLARLRFACVRLGYGNATDLTALAGLLAPAPFVLLPVDDSSIRPLVAIVVPATGRDRLDATLRVSTFEPVEVSEATAGTALNVLEERAHAANEAGQASRKALMALKERVHETLSELSVRAALAVLLLQAQTMFATSGRFLVISGWVPEERASGLAAAIGRVSGGRAVVTVDKPEALPAAYASMLKVPILYRNPLLLRPFQQLVQVYGVPSYGEIQPTAFFAASFLLMFGLMFGDVGHGVVLVSAGYCLFRYLPRYLDYGILLMEAGVSSGIFGVLYGSVFGIETLLPALWMRPIRNLPRFAGIAVMLGIVLVSAGLVLNVVNRWRAGERTEAITSTQGLFGSFVYWVTLALAARLLLPARWILPNFAIFTLLAVAVGLLIARPIIVRALGEERSRPRETPAPRWLVALEASVELVDTMFSYFANTISFVRVAAFAAVHAGVFVAMFALVDTFARFRFGGLLSVAVLVAGNIAMILLEGLTVTVQVLRLEYYEFFSKFFRGGGEPYRPLMLRPNGIEGGD